MERKKGKGEVLSLKYSLKNKQTKPNKLSENVLYTRESRKSRRGKQVKKVYR